MMGERMMASGNDESWRMIASGMRVECWQMMASGNVDK